METQASMTQKLITKAQEDPKFRQSLLDNPRLALKEGMDIDVPSDFNLFVHEESSHTAHLVLPASAELADEQLQQAAGGIAMICPGNWLS